jgi:hypothetical protein
MSMPIRNWLARSHKRCGKGCRRTSGGIMRARLHSTLSTASTPAAGTSTGALCTTVVHCYNALYNSSNNKKCYNISDTGGVCWLSTLMCAGPVPAAMRRALFERTPPPRGEYNASPLPPLRVASVAGGPGFDHVAVHLARSYLSTKGTAPLPVIECTVYDLERKWEGPYRAVVAACRPLVQADR